MSKKPKYKAALIGTGRIGFTLGFDRKREQPASHTMALRKNRRIKFVAACDNNQLRLDHFRRFVKKTITFADCSNMFATDKFDIIVIAVNENSHLDVTLDAIRAKPKLIILEKPVALCVADALKIQEEAEKYKIPILVNHERRFAQDYKIAKKYIDSIGELISVNARLDSGLRVYTPSEEDSGAYSLLHDGTHLVDIVSYLLEEENDLSDLESKILYNMKLNNIVFDKEKSDVVRFVSASFESLKCPNVNINISGKSKFFGFEIDVIGTLGRIRIGNGIFEFYKREESKLYTGFYSLEKDLKVKRPKKTKYFSNMVKNAVDFLDGKAELKSNLQTGINTLRILEDIKNQLKNELL